MLAMMKAVLWDFGGVILTSPFEAFNRYEAEHGLPTDFIRPVNATNPHDNAWALLERSEIIARRVRRAVRRRIRGPRPPRARRRRARRCSPATSARRWWRCSIG